MKQNSFQWLSENRLFQNRRVSPPLQSGRGNKLSLEGLFCHHGGLGNRCIFQFHTQSSRCTTDFSNSSSIVVNCTDSGDRVHEFITQLCLFCCCCMSLEKLPTFSVPQFLHMQNRIYNGSYLICLLQKLGHAWLKVGTQQMVSIILHILLRNGSHFSLNFF